jgi:hypothetical protein
VSEVAVMDLSVRKVVGNSNRFGQMSVVSDHFWENGRHR